MGIFSRAQTIGSVVIQFGDETTASVETTTDGDPATHIPLFCWYYARMMNNLGAADAVPQQLAEAVDEAARLSLQGTPTSPLPTAFVVVPRLGTPAQKRYEGTLTRSGNGYVAMNTSVSRAGEGYFAPMSALVLLSHCFSELDERHRNALCLAILGMHRYYAEHGWSHLASTSQAPLAGMTSVIEAANQPAGQPSEEAAPARNYVLRNVQTIPRRTFVGDWSAACAETAELYFDWLFETPLEPSSGSGDQLNPFQGKRDSLTTEQHRRLFVMFATFRLIVFLRNADNRTLTESLAGAIEPFRSGVCDVFEFTDDERAWTDSLSSIFDEEPMKGYSAFCGNLCERGLGVPAPSESAVSLFVMDLLAKTAQPFLETLQEKMKSRPRTSPLPI